MSAAPSRFGSEVGKAPQSRVELCARRWCRAVVEYWGRTGSNRLGPGPPVVSLPNEVERRDRPASLGWSYAVSREDADVPDCDAGSLRCVGLDTPSNDGLPIDDRT